MIYLTIPKGMVFAKVPLKDGKIDEEHGEIKDCFVDPTGDMPVINIQDQIHKALRTNHKHSREIQLQGFTMCLREPPKTINHVLKYDPCNNGKYPTKSEPIKNSALSFQKYDPRMYSHYGTRWYQHAHLSEEREEQIKEEMLEQKYNRRHEGDDPNPT